MSDWVTVAQADNEGDQVPDLLFRQTYYGGHLRRADAPSNPPVVVDGA